VKITNKLLFRANRTQNAISALRLRFERAVKIGRRCASVNQKIRARNKSALITHQKFRNIGNLIRRNIWIDPVLIIQIDIMPNRFGLSSTDFLIVSTGWLGSGCDPKRVSRRI